MPTGAAQRGNRSRRVSKIQQGMQFYNVQYDKAHVKEPSVVILDRDALKTVKVSTEKIKKYFFPRRMRTHPPKALEQK